MSQAESLRRFIVPVTALSAFALALFAVAGSSNAHAAHADDLQSAASPTPAEATIEKSMHEIADALKVLGKGVTAETRASALDELGKIETALIVAKAATPESAAKIEEKKRAAFVNDYRKTMIETLALACETEKLVIDGKYKDADTMIRNKLSAMKSTGHSKFKPEGGGGK